MKISDIRVGKRYRKEMGDIQSLAESMQRVGLLHPIVVLPDGLLVAGARRLAAARLLGWEEIPARVVDLENPLAGEHVENVFRKDLTPSEVVAIGEALEPLERARAERRQKMTRFGGAGKVPAPDKGQALDKVAAAVGISRRTYERAKAVVEAAREAPDIFGPLQEQMDRTGNVSRAYKELQRLRRAQAKEASLNDPPPAGELWQIYQGDFRDVVPKLGVHIDIIITDPPYERKFLPLYSDLARIAAAVLPDGGSLLMMCGQSYLPEIMAEMAQHITYHWMLAYLTPGGQSAQLWQRRVNTFWKPILWFVKGEYNGDWVGDVARSETNDNDKRFHHWGQSESGMADLIGRFTYPEQTILDPFCGGGTTGAVAVRMNRRFVGIDIDSNAVATARRRLANV